MNAIAAILKRYSVWFFCCAVLSINALPAAAGPRTSASYTINTDTTDGGGRRATSAAYTNDGSAGGIVGISNVAVPAETAKHGYIAQLSEPAGLSITAASPTVNETATDQLGAWLALDDASFLAVPATGVVWSVLSGPLVSINVSGLATAGTVFQNTAAVAQGISNGFTGALSLTVLNVNIDNFGAYAGDTLDDAWQVQYFGLPPNANAGPLRDPDGDGQTNAFEFTAGLIPTDPNSRFTFTIAPVPGQPAEKALSFSPVVAGRSYTITAKSPLTAPAWRAITPFAESQIGDMRTITDRDPSATLKFYRVEITKP